MYLTKRQRQRLKLRGNKRFFMFMVQYEQPDSDLHISWLSESGVAAGHTVDPFQFYFLAFDQRYFERRAHVKTWMTNFSLLHYDYEKSKENNVPVLLELCWVDDVDLIAVSYDITDPVKLQNSEMLHTLQDYVDRKVRFQVQGDRKSIHVLTDDDVDVIIQLSVLQL